MKDEKKARVRIIAAQADVKYVDALMRRCKSLARSTPDMSCQWVGHVGAGVDVVDGLTDGVETGNLFVLLVSQNFLDDEAAFEAATMAMRMRADRKDLTVVPIILRDCLWQREMFSGLQQLPRDGTNLARHGFSDDAWGGIFRELVVIIDSFIAGSYSRKC